MIKLLSPLIGPGQSGDDPVLQPGDYSYPFQFLIPNQNMPTSVEGSHGYVRYWLKGIIDRPWRFDITTTAVFTMLEYVDINTLQLLVSLLCKGCGSIMDYKIKIIIITTTNN